MRAIRKIIIHCAATTPSMDIGVKEIRGWHVNGNGWSNIGYHFVIRRNGMLEHGRPIDLPGSHCKGHNASSIGICLVGGIQDGKGGDANCDGVIEEFENGQKGVPEANYTPEQWSALETIVRDMSDRFPVATIHGHNEFTAKACPCFDVQKWWRAIK